MNRVALSVAASTLLAASVAGHSLAGYRVSTPNPAVTVTRSGTNSEFVTVKGSLGAAHNANNERVYIECRIRGYGNIDDGDYLYSAECRGNNGTYKSQELGDSTTNEPYCWVAETDTHLLNAIVSINGSSHVEFKYDDRIFENRNRCIDIIVENSSKYVSKTASVLDRYKEEVKTGGPWGISGALGSVRASSDNVQEIGCTSSVAQGVPSYAYCWAKDSGGTTHSCTSSYRNVLFAISAVKPDSMLTFFGSPDPGSDCSSRIEIKNSSKFRPAY